MKRFSTALRTFFVAGLCTIALGGFVFSVLPVPSQAAALKEILTGTTSEFSKT